MIAKNKKTLVRLDKNELLEMLEEKTNIQTNP